MLRGLEIKPILEELTLLRSYIKRTLRLLYHTEHLSISQKNQSPVKERLPPQKKKLAPVEPRVEYP